jgi:hypothetical protein
MPARNHAQDADEKRSSAQNEKMSEIHHGLYPFRPVAGKAPDPPALSAFTASVSLVQAIILRENQAFGKKIMGTRLNQFPFLQVE